jgi:alginate biosynthesis protein Alg44
MNNEVRERSVHEAETQRQHVRVRIPLEAEIDGRYFVVRDWSVGGVAFEDLDPPRRVGERFTAKLFFPIDAMEFNLALACEVRHAHPGSGVTGCAFTDLDPAQLSLLHYLVGAYLSGEIVSQDDIMTVLSRENFTKERKQKQTGSPLRERLKAIKRWVTVAALCAIGIGLVVYVAAAIYQHMYVSEFDGFVATSDAVYVRAPADGLVDSLSLEALQPVQKGSNVGAIKDPEGVLTPLSSPCDCVVLATPTPVGSIVDRNAPVAVLAPDGAEMNVVVRMPGEKLRGIAAGKRASLTLFDTGEIVGGTVQAVQRYTPVSSSNDRGLPAIQSYATVTIRPDHILDPARYAEPVHVRIDRLQIFSPRPTSPET